jgi:hypothetical protein
MYLLGESVCFANYPACWGIQGKRMLVFKFMAGGNLWDALQQRDENGECPSCFNYR